MGFPYLCFWSCSSISVTWIVFHSKCSLTIWINNKKRLLTMDYINHKIIKKRLIFPWKNAPCFFWSPIRSSPHLTLQRFTSVRSEGGRCPDGALATKWLAGGVLRKLRDVLMMMFEQRWQSTFPCLMCCVCFFLFWFFIFTYDENSKFELYFRCQS